MPAPEFLDTNIVVHSYDPTDPRKQQFTQGLLRRALAGELVTSTEALAEFAATLLHKMPQPARPEHVTAALDALGPIPLIVPDGDTLRCAVQARARYRIHFYNGMIVAAAERGGCARIWLEDLNSGQEYFGIRVENPFG